MHGCGESIIGGLTHIDVVIGVDGLFGAEFASEHLTGSVGDDFIDIHIGLGAGAALPDG